jgi:hypothetical protein
MLLLIGGLVLTVLSLVVLALAVQAVLTYRRNLRSDGATSIPVLRAHVLVIGCWLVALVVGLFLIMSSHAW